MNSEHFLSITEHFPDSPGVYIMKDTEGVVLYIGKAIKLRSRVRSYFLDTHADRPQIPSMLERLRTIDWIATNNETEALILESNLVREHKPRYNVMLKDDKHYPYLKVTLSEPFPRLVVSRRIHDDGSKYFGPYTDARAMRRMMDFGRKVFGIRNCNRPVRQDRPTRPCINYSMKKCSGACAGKITREEYRRNIALLLQFLQGRRKDLIAVLKERMERAADDTRFEEAALVRDQIRLIQGASRTQQVDLRLTDASCDVFGFHEEEDELCLAVLSFREGLLLSNRHFLFRKSAWNFSESGHDTIVVQYYTDGVQEPPGELLLPDNRGFDAEGLRQWFAGSYDRAVEVTIPKIGTKSHLIGMAEKNAQLYRAQRLPQEYLETLSGLQKALNLPRVPRIIEAFDISNLGEKFAVAGMVRFTDGIPSKSQYRRFRIKTVEGQNDFAMLMEAVSRRLRRLKEEEKTFPDLLLIDGGVGQLHAAQEPLREFSEPPMIVSIAKKEEIIFSPYRDEPVQLEGSDPVRRLVERIRNEVHRWAINYHRNLRDGRMTQSVLEEVPGIGPRMAARLLKRFGSVERIKAASPAEIANEKGITPESARRLLDALSSLA